MAKRRNKPHDVFTKLNMHGGDTTPCWEWLGTFAGNGRPCFDLAGKKVTAYRLIYELMYAKTLDKSVVLRHKCDNMVCCNPHHLEEGSHIDNMRDMKERERHGLPHYTVRAIKKLLNEGRTQTEICGLYGVDRNVIGRIARGEAYQHVGEETEDV